MRTPIRKLILIVVMGLCATSAYADGQETLFNTVNLQAQAEREIPNAEMFVVLATEHEGSNPSEIAGRINTDMQQALAIIKSYDDVNSKTGNYQTYPVYDKQAITGWRGSQQIEIRSIKIPDLTELVGKLQELLQVKDMQFSPTDATRKQYENDLIEEAMEAFRQRVEIVKKHMDNQNYRIISINISTSGQEYPVMFQRADAKMMEMASAPAVEGGTSKLSVTVSGSVQFF